MGLSIDREKVIKGLEKLRKDLGDGLPDRSNVVIWCLRSEYLNSLTDAIAMLKEQEQRIKELEEKLRLLEYGDQDILQRGMMQAT